MRILQVRFKNLNSLVGEWHIDFTHPAYASNGIFAITGPTGAGKTTILDAICLALYGQTPRLKKINQSTNEIMSRQTAQCFSEVTFETKEGRFRCIWSQRRARKKIDGALQSPEHEISEVDSGTILASKVKETAEQIEVKTGMNFDRFMRSMLLAQGDFSAFLDSNQDQRSPILEQITGTEIYSQISIRVHERLREEREKLQRLRDKTDNIEVLQPEEEQEIVQLMESEKAKEQEFSLKIANKEKALAWLKKIDALKNEIGVLEAEFIELQNDIHAFEPDLEKLKKALNAASLDSEYVFLSSVRKLQIEVKNALKTQEENLPKLELSVNNQIELLKQIERQLVQKKDTLKEALPILQRVRSMDQSILEQNKAVKASEDEYKKRVSNLLVTKKDKQDQQRKLEQAYKDRDAIEKYLKEYAQDEQLIIHLSSIETKLNGLALKQNEVVQNEINRQAAEQILKQSEKSVQKLQKQCDIQKQELKTVSENLQQEKKALDQLLGDRLLREYRFEKDTLLREKVLLTTIAELKDHRENLEDGKPCPLCGSVEHPYAEGNIPVLGEVDKKINQLTEMINHAEEQEIIIKKQEEAENQVRNKLVTLETQLELSKQKKSIVEKSFEEKTIALDNVNKTFLSQKENVTTQLLSFGITDIPKENIFSLIDLLKARLNQWLAKDRQRKETEKQISVIENEIKRLDSIIEIQQDSLFEKKSHWENLQKDLNAKNLERKHLYEDKNPDKEEQLLNKTISDSEDEEKLAREHFISLQQEFNTAKGSIDTLKVQIGKRKKELEKLEQDFALSISTIGFLDEEMFQKARLTPDERQTLLAKEKKLNDRQVNLSVRLEDRKARLATELEKKVTQQSLEETISFLNGHKQVVEDVKTRIAALQHQLNENVVAKKKIKESQAEIEAQFKECNRWENLHELIGSADGKKYRNFVQGLTLEVMVHYANQQLLKMTDRYLLVRDEKEPLELNIIDNYQAGEIRTTKNLSGGESFIVSLALALGLSRMSSKNVRVDSLFLDEGFGTLDENALDTALETLSNLQQEGKLIGIISHVSSLKERISTQIVVEPLLGGKSQLSGPGIT